MRNGKRKLKQFIERRAFRENLNLDRVLVFLASMALLLFVVVQLSTNAILSPLGKNLQSFNDEKNNLVEENRSIEYRIAKHDSLIVIEAFSKEKLGLEDSTVGNTIFVADDTVQASKE